MAGHSPASSKQELDTFTSYERGLRQLIELIESDRALLQEVLTYQQRLSENLDLSRRFGDTESRRSDRSEIITQLTRVSLSVLNVSFLDLCGQPVSDKTQSPTRLISHHDLLHGLEQNRRDVEDELRRLKHELLVADEQAAFRLREIIKGYEERYEAILAEIDYEEAKISDERRISALKGKRRATASLEIVRRLMRDVSEDRTKFGDNDPIVQKKLKDIQRYLRIAGEHELSAIRAILYLERARLSFEHYNNPRRALDECEESIAINPNYEEAYRYRIFIREQLRGNATFDQKSLERSIQSDKQKLRELRQNAAGNQTSDREQKHASAADRSNPRRRPGRRAD